MDLIPIRILSASNKTKPKRDPKFIALAQFVVYLKIQLHFGFLCGQGQLLRMSLDRLHIIVTTFRFCMKASVSFCRKKLPDGTLAAQPTTIWFSPQETGEPSSSGNFNEMNY